MNYEQYNMKSKHTINQSVPNNPWIPNNTAQKYLGHTPTQYLGNVGITGYTPYPTTSIMPTPVLSEEWHSVTIATIENREQVIKILTEAINGKHSPLKNKLVCLRIKPGSAIRISRIPVGCDYDSAQVKEEGWDVDQAVIDSIENIEAKDTDVGLNLGLTIPVAYISFKTVVVNQESNPADGFWFQLSDLEWKMV